jgi:hypothetical protein
MARRNLTKLAKRLAPAYDSASPADVEDDVSLSVWVRRETGEELTLQQAEKLRTLIDAEIDRFPKVVIHVSGGVVQGCTSNDKRLRVFVVDDDNLEQEADPAQAEADARNGSEDCVFEVL